MVAAVEGRSIGFVERRSKEDVDICSNSRAESVAAQPWPRMRRAPHAIGVLEILGALGLILSAVTGATPIVRAARFTAAEPTGAFLDATGVSPW
ncbi:hypothetical protein [Amycolatopsis vastitatis]|uniref:hypothetical protein n=1 Tax=Amycolatopsis vastitatis TaxID=1905142 RepID=UPI00130434D7|nr:hypothetical protein [Amycolatopsis vastitatis]